jgi:two-component system, NtrC family, sensor kinase
VSSVLVVDDEQVVLDLLTALLREAGHDVMATPSTAGARELLASRAFDVALVDLVLLDGSGMDLFEPIRALSPGTRVLMMTGSPTVESAVKAVRAGAFDFLTKPVEATTVLLAVSLASEAKRLDDDRARQDDEKREHRELLARMVQERTRELREVLEDRERANEALRAAERQRNDLLDALEEQVVLLDASGRVVWVNRVACEAAGLSRDDLVGRSFGDLPWVDARAWEERPAARSLRSGEASDSERVTLDGRSWWSRAYAMRDRSGRVTGVVEVTHETTRKKTEEQDQRQEQKLLAVGQLASGIAHEINTPTQFVGDNLEFLRDSTVEVQALLENFVRLIPDAKKGTIPAARWSELERAVADADLEYLGEEIPRAIAQSMEGIARVAEIVRAMKEFAHPGSSDMVPANLNEAIRATIAIARNEWKYVSVLETDLDPDLPSVPCQVGEFNQVILNLIINARDSIAERLGEGAEEKGMITIGTRSEDDCAVVTVEDTGTGIPDHLRDQIFDPFFTTKEIGHGSGQGLAIAHNVIAEKHGGKITVENRDDGGTRFVICLPLT